MYFKSTPKARKEHKCYECGGTIKPGEMYERVRAKWDGEMMVIKTCQDCVEIRDALSEMECFCWSHGGLYEEVQTQFQEAYFYPGLRFAFLRILASHRKYGKSI
ncbi:hypothetical protein DJ031_06805 [bacterium endosymbiont of Escarpia laminata]|nr:MAG: hypothetical protein DJ031_06805 [bacterium endosymbiont of Escarpia laminata]